MTLAGTGSCLYGASVTSSATGTFCASSTRAMSMTLLAPCEWPTSTIESVLPCARAQDVLRCGFPGEMPDHLRVDALGVERVGDGVEAGREHTEPASQQKHTRLGAGGTAVEDEDNRDHSNARTDIATVALHALAPERLSHGAT